MPLHSERCKGVNVIKTYSYHELIWCSTKTPLRKQVEFCTDHWYRENAMIPGFWARNSLLCPGKETHPLTLFSTQPFHTLCGPLSLNTASADTRCDQSTSSLHAWHREGIKVKLFQTKSLSIETVFLLPNFILICKLMFKSSGVKQYLIVVGLGRQKFTSTIIPKGGWTISRQRMPPT